jgi:hypothetical protein
MAIIFETHATWLKLIRAECKMTTWQLCKSCVIFASVTNDHMELGCEIWHGDKS